jgi:deoxyribonuclease V
VVEARHVVGTSRFPYVPGLLSFREAPILLRAFAKLKHRPDAVILDGQGTAHPRRLGLAAHVGLWLGVPTVGCAKTRLCGEHRAPGQRVGAQTPLMFREQIIGSVLRTKRNSNPLYVSPGNLIDLAGAVQLVLQCCRGYRLPEPTRQAHLYVNGFRREREARAART